MFQKSKPYSGKIMVTKGTITNPGQLKVTGCKSNRYEFETALAKFTKKRSSTSEAPASRTSAQRGVLTLLCEKGAMCARRVASCLG